MATKLDNEISVEIWLISQFERIGFSNYEAVKLVDSKLYDYHDVETLISAGCPRNLALRILRP